MFLLKSLSGKVLGNNEVNFDNVKLSGELYQQVQQSTIRKVTSECLYLDSLMTIQKTTRPNFYNLVVTRVFEEGEDELENDNSEDELSEDYYEKVFLITEDSRFVKKVWDHDDKKQNAFFWLEKSDDNTTIRYVFVPYKESDSNISNFEKVVYQCIYESKFEEKYTNADEETLNDYIEDYKVKSAVYNTEEEIMRRSSVIQQDELQKNETSTPQDSANVESVNNVNQQKSLPSTKNISEIKKDLSVNAEGDVYCKPHNIFKYDTDDSEFKLIGSNTPVRISKYGKFDYIMKVDGDIQVEKKIDSNMNESFNHEFKSFIWCITTDKNLNAYSIVFDSVEDKDEFQRIINLCKYESVQRKSIQKAKDNEEFEYLLRAFDNNLVITDDEEEHDFTKDHPTETTHNSNEPNSYFVLEDESDEENNDDDEEEEEEEEEETNKIIKNETQPDEDEDEEEQPPTDDGLTNEELAMAYKYDRSFVVRGNKIGVFKHTDNEKLKYVTTIDNIQGLDNTKFVPESLMLHEQDNALLMLNKDAYDSDENKVFKMDLNRGKVVEEYNTDYEYIKGLCPTSKYAQLTGEKTFLGYRENSLFLLDPRLQNKNYMDVKFQYTTNPKFTCMSTTGNGNIVLGNEKGKISLYNRVGVKATTVLPGIGDEIIAIDVTNDGRYLVATTKTYLLFVDVKDMFEYSSKKRIKPVPRKLQLSPQDIVNMKEEISFTPARFDIGEGLERSIITSTGPYMITWNLRRLKLNHDDSYRIRRCNDTIISENFRYNENKNIVFTSPNNVAMVTDGMFRSPKAVFSKKK